MSSPQTLIDYIEDHERDWGNETYVDRPRLAEILQAPVVVFWQRNNVKDEEKRTTITLHQSLDEIEQFIIKLVFRTNLEPPKQKIANIFKNGKRVRISAVHIEFEEME